MLDLRVLAALAIALVVALFAVGNLGETRDLIEKGLGKASLLADRVDLPIPGLAGSAVPVKLLLESEVAIQPDSAVDVRVGAVNITGFRGALAVDRGAKLLRISQGELAIAAPLAETRFENVVIGTLSVQGAAFTILPNVTTENGSLELRGFRGSLVLSSQGALLDGNVTSLRTAIGGREWELR